MGTDDLITAYVQELRRTLRWAPHGEDALLEVEDHLRCAAEKLEASGASAADAEREALTRFGPADEVARGLARGPQSKPALPSASTVSGAAMPLAAGSLWTLHVVALLGVIHLYSRFDSNTADDQGSPLGILVMMPWAATVVGGVVLTFVTGMVLKERFGGFTWVGWLGMAALLASCAASFVVWLTPGWGAFLALGTALLAVELVRSGVAPRLPSVALGVGPAVGFAVWGALRFMEFGSPDEWGNYPAASATGIAVGCAIGAIALFGLGRWLRHEEPVLLAGRPLAPVTGA